ncbi:MIB [Mytilus edulis]|uniref:MIB n=1 Tax=Mytilus edulis TaxID=6550 RepID=A0A8S3QZ34_MYTED|nr:MIB [Mytilus edulis]
MNDDTQRSNQLERVKKDGGEGHLGTVVCVKENNSVDVVWDNGNLTTCNIGKDGRRELRVVDNAPAGIKHYGIACNVCKRQPILGTRWKCGKCNDINLCTICYFSDKHDLSHEFERYNRQTTSRPETVKKEGHFSKNACTRNISRRGGNTRQGLELWQRRRWSWYKRNSNRTQKLQNRYWCT